MTVGRRKDKIRRSCVSNASGDPGSPRRSVLVSAICGAATRVSFSIPSTLVRSKQPRSQFNSAGFGLEIRNGQLVPKYGLMPEHVLGGQHLGKPNGPAQLDAEGTLSGNSVIAAGTSTPRKLTQRFADTLNLRDAGAKLDGSEADLGRIQAVYDSVPSGAVIYVPADSRWNGTVPEPNPKKVLSWSLLGGFFPNPYNTFIGDGDLSVSYRNGSARFSKISKHSAVFDYPLTSIWWNCDSNFQGPYSGDYQQLASAAFTGLSGPSSQGNTSAAVFNLHSYGTNPAGAYDVSAAVYANKYGQNSVWGIVVQAVDSSGTIPQAFSCWNEFDILANGFDRLPSDPSFHSPRPAGRVGAWYHFSTLGHGKWRAQTDVHTFSQAPDQPREATTILVTAADSKEYVWICKRAGVTGTNQPRWPAPAMFTGSIEVGVLTVSAITSQSLGNSDYIVGTGFVGEIQIVVQLTGKLGGIGTYLVSGAPQSVALTGMYSAPKVVDGTAEWRFGTNYDATVSGGVWLTGDAVVRTVVGTDLTVENAVIDSSLATLMPGAAVIRIAPDQVLDFSAEGTATAQNTRVLYYGAAQGERALIYKVRAERYLAIGDDGHLASRKNILDDGSGNVFIAGTVVNAAVQLIDTGGDCTVGPGVKTAVVKTSRAITFALSELNSAPGTVQDLDITFAVANRSVSWRITGRGYSLFGAILPSTVRAGDNVHLRWIQDLNAWVHLLAV